MFPSRNFTARFENVLAYEQSSDGRAQHEELARRITKAAVSIRGKAERLLGRPSKNGDSPRELQQVSGVRRYFGISYELQRQLGLEKATDAVLAIGEGEGLGLYLGSGLRPDNDWQDSSGHTRQGFVSGAETGEYADYEIDGQRAREITEQFPLQSGIVSAPLFYGYAGKVVPFAVVDLQAMCNQSLPTTYPVELITEDHYAQRLIAEWRQRIREPFMVLPNVALKALGIALESDKHGVKNLGRTIAASDQICEVVLPNGQVKDIPVVGALHRIGVSPDLASHIPVGEDRNVEIIVRRRKLIIH